MERYDVIFINDEYNHCWKLAVTVPDQNGYYQNLEASMSWSETVNRQGFTSFADEQAFYTHIYNEMQYRLLTEAVFYNVDPRRLKFPERNIVEYMVTQVSMAQILKAQKENKIVTV